MLIRAMRPELASDWMDFFDTRAFADHAEWKGCYCTFFFLPKPPEYEGASARRRDYAAWLIERGSMKGYLAFENGKAVAWCNVNEKAAFPKLAGSVVEGEKVLSIACFLVQQDHRGRGVAQKLLDRIIKDAKTEGIRVVEAYPSKKAKTEFGNFHGSFSMYEKNGFKPERIGDGEVVRRYL